MKHTIPSTPFSTPLSGSARETELRLKNIFSGPKKRPPALFLALVFAMCLFCGNLVSCQVSEAEWSGAPGNELPPPDLTMVQVDWDSLPASYELTPFYALEEDGNVRITNLGDTIVVWNRSDLGNLLYFAEDPAFCCPSLAGRVAEGSAQWLDEPGGAVSVSISINDDRLKDGTIDGYYLEFTVDRNNWTVLESEFTSDVGDGTLELSEQEMVYAAQVLSTLMRDAEWTAAADVTLFPQHPDLNRNGVPEEIRLYSHEGVQRLYVLEDGTPIHSEEGYSAHAGWNALFLCTLDGENYLLSYSPTMYQGFCDYGYELYTLEGNGKKVVRQNSVSFDINIGSPMFQEGGYDPDEIADFMEEINELLSHSVQLLNTDQDLLGTFEKEGRLEDTLWFLHIEPEVFTPDPDKSLRENLWDYRNTMERAVSQP